MSSYLSSNHQLVELLRSGGIAVIRTDTLYGLVASADNEAAVERVYAVKGRDQNKSCIILLSSMDQAYVHSDDLAADRTRYDTTRPTSFLIHSPAAPVWLLRENEDLAYRVPADADLQELLVQTGPLVAPSANPQGLPPARTIEEAKAYFADEVDLYVDGGEVPVGMPPSRLIRVYDDGTVEYLR